MDNHWNLVCYKQAVFIKRECGLCRSTWPRFSPSEHLDSAIVISSVDFQLFLLNFRSLKISYILSLATEKANELKRGPWVFGLWGLMPSVEMEGVASVLLCRCFPFELGNKSSLFGSHQPIRLNITTEHFYYLFSYPAHILNSWQLLRSVWKLASAWVIFQDDWATDYVSCCWPISVCYSEFWYVSAFLVWNRSGFSILSRWKGRGVSCQSVGQRTHCRCNYSPAVTWEIACIDAEFKLLWCTLKNRLRL